MTGRREPSPHDVCGVEAVIARLASRQDGIVTRQHLLDRGLTRHEIDGALKRGGLIPVYRAVYAAGHTALSARGRIRAALLAAGPGAAASHSTAAYLHKLLPTLPAVLHISLVGRQLRSRPGLRVHVARALETTRVDGFFVTSVTRTLEDLRWEDRIVREALARRLIRPEDVRLGLEHRPTRNDFQDRMQRLVTKAGLPAPASEHPIGPYLADFAWPAHRLSVETDGWATHGYRAAFERDRGRDAYLAARGWTVIRITWRQLRREPLKVAATIAAALAHREAG